MADDFTFEITKNIGVVSEGKGGWKMELNLVSWGGRPAQSALSLCSEQKRYELFYVASLRDALAFFRRDNRRKAHILRRFCALRQTRHGTNFSGKAQLTDHRRFGCECDVGACGIQSRRKRRIDRAFRQAHTACHIDV